MSVELESIAAERSPFVARALLEAAKRGGTEADFRREAARIYFLTEVAGQARATLEAKQRGLARFLAFYQKLYHHDRPEEWFPSVTREFLKQLRRARPAQATVVRTYASVRHFARWIHHKVRPKS